MSGDFEKPLLPRRMDVQYVCVITSLSLLQFIVCDKSTTQQQVICHYGGADEDVAADRERKGDDHVFVTGQKCAFISSWRGLLTFRDSSVAKEHHHVTAVPQNGSMMQI